MPSSPPLKGQSTVGTTTLGPKTHTLQPRGNVSAIQHQQPVSRSNRAQSALPNTLTPAEAYANAHHPISGTRSQREREKEKDGKGKPLFDWISRKLGGSAKRGAEGVNPHSSGSGSGTQESANGRSGPSRLQGRSNQVSQPNGLHPQSTHSSDDLTRQNSIAVSRSESHSLRSYSLSFVNTIEHERRREANNPYPSIPVPPQHRESTIDSVSLSLLSRSSSMDSSIRPRISLYDDSSVRWMGDGGADEDASIRPFPPSHQASPTPSHSILSRSVSADLLSPIIYRQRSRSSSVNRPEMPSERRIIDSAASASSRSSNDTPDDLSRRDSASTKPTTVLSFESAPRVAHIAQSHSVASSHPASPLSQTVSSGVDPNEVGLNTPTTPGSPLVASPPSPPSPTINLVQAPKHSHPHPRDNPRPSSPPRDNASTVTLASSTFNLAPTPIGPSTPAVPGPSTGRFRDLAAPLPQGPFIRPGSIISSPSVTFAPETMGDSTRPVSIFNYGQGDAFAGGSSYTPSLNAVSLHGIAPSISIRTGWTGRGDRVADSNASVKAIRRKGSWESYQSGWSWRAAQQLDDTANMPPVEGGEDTGVQLREGMFSPLNGSVGNASKSLQSDSTAESMSQPQYQPIHDRDDSEGDGGGFARNGYNTIWNGQMSLDLTPPLRPDRSKTSLRESPMPKDGYGSGHGAYHHHAEESDYDETPGIGLKRFSLGSASPVTA